MQKHENSKFRRMWECIRRHPSAFTAADMAECAGCSLRHARRLLRLLAREGLIMAVGAKPTPRGRRGKGPEMWICVAPDAEIKGTHRGRSQAEADSLRWVNDRRKLSLSAEEVADAVFYLLEQGAAWADICSRTRLRGETLRAAIRDRGLTGAPAGRLRRMVRERLDPSGRPVPPDKEEETSMETFWNVE